MRYGCASCSDFHIGRAAGGDRNYCDACRSVVAYVPGDTGGTKHTLNVFGAPRADDADMTFDVLAGTVSGLWDASDENSLMPAPSAKPGDYLAELFASELFMMIHTQTVPSGAYGGFLVAVPESASVVLIAIAGLGLIGMRRRR